MNFVSISSLTDECAAGFFFFFEVLVCVLHSVNIRTRIFELLLFCHFLLDITHFLYIFLHHFVHKHAPKDIM